MRTPTQTSRATLGQGGFTLIEIVVALTVFMIAVMGMTALQGASIHAAAKSRRQTAAVNIARYVITELKGEFASWDKDRNNTNFPTGRYPLLASVFSGNAVDQWIQYGDAVSDGDLRLDEFLGHNALAESNSGASRFCVNYRITSLENLGAGTPPESYSVWQIRVRVSWTKDSAFQTNDTPWNVCDPATVDTRIVIDASDDVVELTAMATRELAK